jgi:hypothetical protein
MRNVKQTNNNNTILQSMIWLQQAKAQKGMFLSGKTEKARNRGQIGAELEYALFCIDEAIDRAKVFTFE